MHRDIFAYTWFSKPCWLCAKLQLTTFCQFFETQCTLSPMSNVDLNDHIDLSHLRFSLLTSFKLKLRYNINFPSHHKTRSRLRLDNISVFQVLSILVSKQCLSGITYSKTSLLTVGCQSIRRVRGTLACFSLFKKYRCSDVSLVEQEQLPRGCAAKFY